MMTKKDDYLTNLEEEVEKKANIVPFIPKLITGGKSGGGGNWLADMKLETVFLVKPRSSGGFALGQFHLLNKYPNACRLMDNSGNAEVYIWVDPVSFCSQFDLVRVLYEPEDDSSNS